MDITLTDNGDGTFALMDQDRATLASSILITPDYKGVAGHLVRYVDGIFEQANDYDPQGDAQKNQAQIDALTANQSKLLAQAATQAKLTPAPTTVSPLAP